MGGTTNILNSQPSASAMPTCAPVSAAEAELAALRTKYSALQLKYRAVSSDLLEARSGAPQIFLEGVGCP